MSEYEDDHFEADSEPKHLLRLSIDLLSIKDLKLSANVSVGYTVNLNKTHTFKSSPSTPLNSGGNETKLANAFAAYEFQATKHELYGYLNDAVMAVQVMHMDKSGGQSEIGQVLVEMKEIFQAPQKKTPQAVVRVADQYLPIKDSNGQAKGLLRTIMYLEDLGEVQQPVNNHRTVNQENKNPNLPQQDYQVVWQLEMWKRAEEAKFKAYLKHKEIERIEEITY